MGYSEDAMERGLLRRAEQIKKLPEVTQAIIRSIDSEPDKWRIVFMKAEPYSCKCKCRKVLGTWYAEHLVKCIELVFDEVSTPDERFSDVAHYQPPSDKVWLFPKDCRFIVSALKRVYDERQIPIIKSRIAERDEYMATTQSDMLKRFS